MADYYTTRRGVLAAETVVDRRRLVDLERKAAVVDAYEDAARDMRDRQAEYLYRPERDAFADGWLAALREYAELVVASRRRSEG